MEDLLNKWIKVLMNGTIAARRVTKEKAKWQEGQTWMNGTITARRITKEKFKWQEG